MMSHNTPPQQTKITDTLTQVLACAVLNSELRTILIYDAPWYGLQQVADYLQILAEASGQTIERILLGSADHEDDLWGSALFPSKGLDTYAVWHQARCFSPERTSTATQLLLIPDLTRVSLSVARACIMQMDVDVVHLERHGQSATWQPRQYWLVSCDSKHIGMVSPHILDRIPLRLAWRGLDFQTSEQTRVLKLQQQLHATQEHPITLMDVGQNILTALQYAQILQPTITNDALVTMKDYLPLVENEKYQAQIYHRREIALARYTLTLARLSGAPTIEIEHIEQAANLLNMHSQGASDSYPNVPQVNTERLNKKKTQSGNTHETTTETETLSESSEPTRSSKERQISKSATAITQLQTSVVLPEITYLEDSDSVLIERDESSLRLPLRHSTTSRSDRGPIIGTEPGDSLRDIAIISTLIQASLFRNVRQSEKSVETSTLHPQIKILQEDLRRYRRAAVPEQLFLLLLDYTSLGTCNWQETLLPYLQQAYVDRAKIIIVKVGAQNPKSELQAEIISERKLLTRGVERALTTQAGRATPLAHGLYLAYQALQKNIQHGRSTVARVTFVVISDGRGNVPLEVSMQGKKGKTSHVKVLPTR